MLTESHATKKVEEEAEQLYSCISCERVPELADVNGLFTEDQVGPSSGRILHLKLRLSSLN